MREHSLPSLVGRVGEGAVKVEDKVGVDENS